MENRSLYYGLTYLPAMKEKRAEMQEAMSFINSNGDFIKGSDWLYYKFTSYEDGYENLRKLIVKMVHKANDILQPVQEAALIPYLKD